MNIHEAVVAANHSICPL